ncbi:complement C1q-like protein 3 [Saccostrea echinata]|uniref:complement C1q-like protein 3 n=1 Tax=Saccostrea echinata TaxID=191078 RepID=UPI002A81D024|nr:complement C1q-like protein 3 [Saccostrea echinata]
MYRENKRNASKFCIECFDTKQSSETNTGKSPGDRLRKKCSGVRLKRAGIGLQERVRKVVLDSEDKPSSYRDELCPNMRKIIQSDTRTELDSLKSLIYSNAKATVTLDSTALEKLAKLSTSASSHLTPRVSFSVNVRSRRLTVGNEQTIEFDGILTNDGNGYDDRTGVFVCPVAGTYMFVFDCLCYLETQLHILVNKEIVASAYKDPKGWNQISRTVIVKLKQGDHMKVEFKLSAGRNAKIHQDEYSGFVGMLHY